MSRARDLASSGVTSTVLSEKAPLASPAFTGNVSATNIKHASSGSNNLVLGSDGTTTASGLVSLSNGINGILSNQNDNSTVTNLLSTSFFRTAVSTTIQPKTSSSKLFVLANIALFTSNTQSSVKLRIRCSASGHTDSHSPVIGYSGYQYDDGQLIVNVPIFYIFTVSNTNTYTLTAEGQLQTGEGRFNYDDAGGESVSTIIVLEI